MQLLLPCVQLTKNGNGWRCYESWRLPEKQKLMHKCQDVLQLSYFHFELLVSTCLLKNKTVTKLSKNLYRSREGFVEKDFKEVPLIDWYKATQTGTRFTSITAMLISLSVSRNRCDRHAWSRWFGENLLFTTGSPRRLVELGLLFCPRSTFPSVLN